MNLRNQYSQNNPEQTYEPEKHDTCLCNSRNTPWKSVIAMAYLQISARFDSCLQFGKWQVFWIVELFEIPIFILSKQKLD